METLEQSILYMDHLEKLERCQNLFILYGRAVKRGQQRRHQAAQYGAWGMNKSQDKWETKAEASEAASQRVLRAYHNLLGELYQTSIL